MEIRKLQAQTRRKPLLFIKDGRSGIVIDLRERVPERKEKIRLTFVEIAPGILLPPRLEVKSAKFSVEHGMKIVYVFSLKNGGSGAGFSGIMKIFPPPAQVVKIIPANEQKTVWEAASEKKAFENICHPTDFRLKEMSRVRQKDFCIAAYADTKNNLSLYVFGENSRGEFCIFFTEDQAIAEELSAKPLVGIFHFGFGFQCFKI